MPLSLDRVLAIARTRYERAKSAKVLIPGSRQALFGSEDNIILSTYDHLRSPFSNRQITADARLSAIAHDIGVRCVSVCLDLTVAPGLYVRGSSRGDQIGLLVFSKKLSPIDNLFSYPRCFLGFQGVQKVISIEQTQIQQYVHDPLVSYLRSIGRSKSESLACAETVASRAMQVASIYSRLALVAHNDQMGASEYLLAVRNGMWDLLGVSDFSTGIDRQPISRMKSSILEVLLLMEQASWFPRFITNCKATNLRLFESISSEGYHDGSIYSEDGAGSFQAVDHIHRAPIGQRLHWANICLAVEQGLAFPTTALLYLILHLGTGFPHFGDSHQLGEKLCSMMGVSEPDLELMDDGANSTSVTLITLPLGVTQRQQRNVTIDALWFGGENYKVLCNLAVRQGLGPQVLTLGPDIPLQDYKIDRPPSSSRVLSINS